MNLDEKITENLRFEIKNSGKKITEIAKAIGVRQSTVSQYCSGRSQPTLATLSKLCSFIGASADDILEIKKD
ncbi:MAG: helix-turn-helix domain-containing protein [Clostridia bacterium]|nr:helix-turn-helix domain-containing protein [Clostridia bacterium]MDE6676300.1 helix-turn-helix domain-containing protein [Clostridia bacterium]